jgi:hypothetical protein
MLYSKILYLPVAIVSFSAAALVLLSFSSLANVAATLAKLEAIYLLWERYTLPFFKSLSIMFL